MKLSTRARYGLRALIDLGLYSETEAVSIQSIATRQNISVSYLEQLMALLKKAGLVKSIRGAGGGYRLGKPAQEISVGEILRMRARYGLRALIDLGLYSETEAVSIQSIATRQNISVSYLEQLMALLKKAGLVKSIRGAGGGYRLGKPAQEISVGEILRILEGGLEAVKCPGNEEDGSCQDADFCVAKYVWKRINDSITDAVDHMNLGELLEESHRIQDKKKKQDAII